MCASAYNLCVSVCVFSHMPFLYKDFIHIFAYARADNLRVSRWLCGCYVCAIVDLTRFNLIWVWVWSLFVVVDAKSAAI